MLIDYLKTLPQYLIPQYTLTRLLGWLASLRITWLKNSGIKSFIWFYGVDMSEAVAEDPQHYPSFNDFFTRALKTNMRPIAADNNDIVSPADGTLSQFGVIENGSLIQAKGHQFGLHDLLGADLAHTELFTNGSFATIYLSPKDYHRVHMPFSGKLIKMVYIPGKLFAVNNSAARVIPQLFSKNERVVCLFETAIGPMAVVFVGALIVGSIHTAWHGAVTPPHNQNLHQWNYPNAKTESRHFNTGDEIGHFQLGSTVIVLFGEQKVSWLETLTAHQTIKMGAELGNLNHN